MLSENEIRSAVKAQGMRTKRNNFLAAVISGSLFLFVSLEFFPHSAAGIVTGFFVGLLYANAFEYCLHRFLLHSGRGFFWQQHMTHHATLNSPEAARYVNFSRNLWGVVALFVVNSAPFLLVQWITGDGWASGVFASFTLYYIAFEEIHWRAHLGGWLPKWLRPAATHHLLHHAQESGRFNVFLPVFDWLAKGFQPQPRVHRDEARR